MSFTGNGWYLLSTTTDQTISQAMASWGISTSTVYKYMYELKNAPILASPTVQLTADNWVGTDISANPTSLLNPMKAYWVNIQTLIVDMILSGTGTLDNSTVSSKIASTSPLANVIIQDYTNIGANAFSGVNSLKSIIIPNSVISIGDQAFSNTQNLSTVTIVADSKLIQSSYIAATAFQNSKLKTVIFESISNLQGLDFIISDASQNFFGASCLVLPTKVAVQSTLSIMQQQMPSYQNTATQALSAFNTANDAATAQEHAAKTAAETITQAQAASTSANNAVEAAQAALNRILSKYYNIIAIAEFEPDYIEAKNELTAYQNQSTIAYNNVVSATTASAFAQIQSATAQATLAATQMLLTQANNSLDNFQRQITALTNALISFAV